MKSLGERIRTARITKELLLREVAAMLGVDPSLLSRIERGKKRATREQVLQIAGILAIDKEDLLAVYLSDRLIYELKGERLALRATRIAEERIAYESKKKRRRGRTSG